MGRLMKKLALRLQQEGPVDLTPQTVALLVAERIEARASTAVVRLGEAEAILLAVREDDNETIDLAARTLRLQTGLNILERDVLRIAAHVGNALRRADILGIRPGKGTAQLAAARRIEAELARALAEGRKPVIISSHRLNHVLTEALPSFFALQRRVSVISCRDLAPVLRERYGVEDAAVYQVPSAFDGRAADGDYEAALHGTPIWPDFYRALEERLAVREPGEIFLVGAGLLGKNLCTHIRRKGGIALDLGTSLDALAGRTPRGERKARPASVIQNADTRVESDADADPGAPPPVVLFTADRDAAGIYEIASGLTLEVLEPSSEKKHTHFRGSLPESNGIEDAFQTGAVLLVHADDGVVDVQAGLTLAGGIPVRETAVIRRLTEAYDRPSQHELENAGRMDDEAIVLPLASQRMANYFHFWADSIAKHFIASRSPLLKQRAAGRRVTNVMPPLKSAFQWNATAVLSADAPVVLDGRNRLYRGASVNTAGLTYGGAQGIARIAPAYSAFLRGLLPPSAGRGGERLYVSRSQASMRRILNEDELASQLRDLGFTVLVPEHHSLAEQMAAFNRARVVMSAHGAGLTNMLVCNPGTTLIEIFPEGGVHPSSFFRIASLLEFPYYYIVGKAEANRAGARNPNNLDLSLDIPDVTRFLKSLL